MKSWFTLLQAEFATPTKPFEMGQPVNTHILVLSVMKVPESLKKWVIK
jgi:hypothetical protein